MIDEAEARQIAEIYAARTYRRSNGTVAVDHELTRECKFGWMFLINTVEYITTRKPRTGLVGQGWLLVLRSDGAYVQFYSSQSYEEALAEYEADPGRHPSRYLVSDQA